jgi:hypothetical protein
MYTEKNLVVGGATVIFGGQPLGWTRDALTIGVEEDKLKIDDVQQIMGVIDTRRTKFGMVIKLNLYEFTLENLRIAWGLNAAVVQGTTVKTLDIKVTGDYPEGALTILAKGENNVLRTFKWYKAKLVDRGDISIDAFGYTVIPVTFQILRHPDYTRLGYIEQEYVPSSIVTD